MDCGSGGLHEASRAHAANRWVRQRWGGQGSRSSASKRRKTGPMWGSTKEMQFSWLDDGALCCC